MSVAPGSAYRFPDDGLPVQIAFSGGRTSGYMLRHILDANPDFAERAEVCFQNTGREMPQTLDFVQECSERWGVPITWIEYRPDAPRFAVVNHNSAARDGEPFEALIRRRKFLPNQNSRFCTAELKVHASTRYAVAKGWTRWTKAVGIRADELRRIPGKPPRERFRLWHPLVADGVTKATVVTWWARQPFDLRLPVVAGKSALGNCDGCFLKSERTLAMLARDMPERHAWWERMEALATDMSGGGGGATFSKRFSRADLRRHVERQRDWIFDMPDALCQADGGECI